MVKLDICETAINKVKNDARESILRHFHRKDI